MIAVLLAALSALVWGAGDFCGGKATQGASAVVVSVVSKLASLPVLAVYLLLLRATPHPESLAWGAAAGFVGMTGLIIFYRALSGGAMIVVAPISAVTAALVPMIVGLVIERSPQPAALAGAICAVVAIALVSAGRSTGRTVVSVGLVGWSLLAGTAFGLFFVLLNRAHDVAGRDVGLWPIAAAQTAALVLGCALLVATRVVAPRLRRPALSAQGLARPTLSRLQLRWAVTAGVLDMSANVLYLLAVGGGLLSIVAPVAAMYPASTVLLARTVDREPIRPLQLAGLGLAAVALVLVAS
ncbi:MAG TPA: EamA family transporter [Micromonosporaceae bacterium]|nr:EamA family transporter [Micromonosporaceae bacterium]